MSFLSEILSCKGDKTHVADREGRIAAEVLDSRMSVRVRGMSMDVGQTNMEVSKLGGTHGNW